jgi:hypothetical protein
MNSTRNRVSRRRFIQASVIGAGGLLIGGKLVLSSSDAAASSLPVGSTPAPVPFPHFPDRLHAFVWRNWSLVPVDRLAKVVGDLFCNFSSVGAWSKWGSWGLLQFYDDDPARSPKFMATMRWAKNLGQPVRAEYDR